jgi:putative tryptophan/tyrosine transport system substrate-binding protein
LNETPPGHRAPRWGGRLASYGTGVATDAVSRLFEQRLADTYRFNADSFREGSARGGFIEGRNVRIEERWAYGNYEALPALAAELVAMGVVAIAATGDVASARAAQRASSTIPVVFTIGGDPVRFGLVKSLNRPGGNVTGILFNQNVLGGKRVELLREIAPNVLELRC